MKKFTFVFLSLCVKAGFAQTFYQKLPSTLALDYDIAAVEIANGYILGDNEVNAANNFHGVIRLIHTDYSGNIIWAKQYDAGSGTTVHLLQLIKTFDNHVLAAGYICADNNAIASQKIILKLDTGGNVIWSKQYSSALAYQEIAMVQLSDSNVVFAVSVFSGGNFPALYRIDAGGNVLSAVKFNVINSAINNIVAYNNTLDIIVNSFYVLNTNLSGGIINWQRQYNNSMQFNSLLSNRCANGDLIYIAGQITGGFGEGTSRIFRTDSLGNLKWSKNVLAWRGVTSDPGSNFDVISHVAIKESADGHVVGASIEEAGTLLFSAFDSSGNFLFNRNHVAPGQQYHVTETASGNYLIGSIFGFNSFSTFASYLLVPANPCDSILTVSITPGVDSAATMAPVTVSAETVGFTNFTLTSTPINISPVVYCNPTGIAEMETAETDFSVYPNPASNALNLHLDNLRTAQLKIINVLGEALLQKPILNGDNKIDLSGIKEGVYFVTITSDMYHVNSRKMIVLKK